MTLLRNAIEYEQNEMLIFISKCNKFPILKRLVWGNAGPGMFSILTSAGGTIKQNHKSSDDSNEM